MPLTADPSGENDVIAAPATPPGTSALAIVRMTGPAGAPRRVLARLAPSLRDDWPSRQARLLKLSTPSGEPLDDVIVLFFEEPRSSTGEEVVEVTCHGSPAVVRALLVALGHAGARPARPGEFSRRALKNGKLDLARAEGLNQLIAAQSQRVVRGALGMVRGELSRRVREARERLLDVLAEIEGALDFAEDLPELEPGNLLGEISRIKVLIESLITRGSQAKTGDIVPAVAILGRPNAGKSTLFNALLGMDRAIVTEIPGTTRDAISEIVEWHGYRVRLVDTAGLRDSVDRVERIGVEVARDTASSADLVLYLVDGSEPPARDDLECLGSLPRERVLVVRTKSDLGSVSSELGDCTVSALTGKGLRSLEREIQERLHLNEKETVFLVLERQREALIRADSLLEKITSREIPESGELWSLVIREALMRLGEITGETATEDLLDRIFSKFCVGK